MAERVKHAGGSLFDFGPLAREYASWYETPAGQAHDRVQKEDVRKVLLPAQAGERVLDVGCGTGHWSSFFQSMGYHVQGVDISSEMIAVAQASVPECSFDVADVFALPFDEAFFDIVAAMATLEFVPDAAAAVEEMVRCTKPGGSMLVGTLNKLTPLNRHRLSAAKQPYASAYLFSPDELRSLLAPWGRVRMVASSPREHKGRSSLFARIAHRLPTLCGGLRGPFIVAEVRR